MPLTVTATASGPYAEQGIALTVKVVTGAAVSQPGSAAANDTTVTTGELGITPAATGSWVYGAAVNGAAATGFTAAAGTTLSANVPDPTNTVTYATFRTTGTTTASVPVTAGASAPAEAAGFIGVAVAEILASGTLAEDASSPSPVSTPVATAAATPSFAPPAGSLLVAMVAANTTGAGDLALGVSDTAGLSWALLAQSPSLGTAAVFAARYEPPSPPAPAWLAARTGLPGDAGAVNLPGQVSQFLVSHGITPVYEGDQLIIPLGQAASGGIEWVNLGTSDVDQPFTMPGGAAAIGRVTLPLSPSGSGADVTVSLCEDSGGLPGTVLASARVPGSWLAQLAAPSGLGAGGPLATAQQNAVMSGDGTTAAWAQPAVSLNGAGSFATPVTSGNCTILAGGYDSTAGAPVATVSTVAYLGGQVLSGPVPQPSLPKAAFYAMAAATADTVVFAGGMTASAYLSSVWTASWDPSTGTVGAWTAQAALPAAVVSGAMAASGSTVYAIGGNATDSSATSTAAVWHASAVNGQIQSWGAGPALPQALSSPYAAVVNGWLIVAGGVDTAGTAQSAVYLSPVQANGSLGGWQDGPPLPVPAYAFAPGWNLAVTGSAIVIVSGPTAGGLSAYTQALTVTADGPALAWQVPDCFSPGEFQAGCYPGGAPGSWQAFSLHLASYDSVELFPLPVISVPLPVSGLTPGGTYHILCHQDGGDANDCASIALDPAALPSAAQSRPAGGGSWTAFPDGLAVIASPWDQSPGGPVLHTWEDSGARITSMIYGGAYGQLLGLCEATAFPDGTVLAAVTQVTYNAAGQPSGLVQLALGRGRPRPVPDSALLSILASAGVAGVFCVLFVCGLVFPKFIVDDLKAEIGELKEALEAERDRANASVAGASATRDILAAIQLGRSIAAPPGDGT